MVKLAKGLQKPVNNSLLSAIRNLVESARQSVIRTIDSAMTLTYFLLPYQTRVNMDLILQTTSAKFISPFPLSWSHYLMLSRIADENERNFYETEAANSNWTLTELERQYNSSLYERLVLSKNKKKIKELSEKGHILEMSLPEDNKQIFASKYQLYLPSKEELKKLIQQ